MLNRIAATNPSTDKTTPNMQAGRTLQRQAAIIEHLHSRPHGDGGAYDVKR